MLTQKWNRNIFLKFKVAFKKYEKKRKTKFRLCSRIQCSIDTKELSLQEYCKFKKNTNQR